MFQRNILRLACHLLSCPEDRGGKFLWNIGWLSTYCMVLYRRSWYSVKSMCSAWKLVKTSFRSILQYSVGRLAVRGSCVPIQSECVWNIQPWLGGTDLGSRSLEPVEIVVGRRAPECWTHSQDLFACDSDHKFTNKVSRQFSFMCYCYTHCEFTFVLLTSFALFHIPFQLYALLNGASKLMCNTISYKQHT
jgi:hypothetical protein